MNKVICKHCGRVIGVDNAECTDGEYPDRTDFYCISCYNKLFPEPRCPKCGYADPHVDKDVPCPNCS